MPLSPASRMRGPAGPMRRRSRRPVGRTLRGSTQLEFALILPFFLLFLVFTVNMGALIVQHGALQHAVSASARAGAQAGGASVSSTSSRVFHDTVRDMPGLQTSKVHNFQVLRGSTCRISGANRDVAVRTTYRAPLTVPGMNALIRMVGGKATSNTWTLRATGVARCEVVRR